MAKPGNILLFPLDPLTEREIEILYLLKAGYSNKRIANHSHLSLNTVKWYTKQIYSKLGVRSRTQAIIQAEKLGLYEGNSHSLSQSNDQLLSLPDPITPFIGRESECNTVISLLKSHRLVTMVGTPGTGKTRLALRVTRRMSPHFSDGAAFVKLAPVTLVEDIPRALFATLRLQPPPQKTEIDTLKLYFRNRHFLLLMDNFEHLVNGGATLVTLLEAAPQLHILVTSREALNVNGEQQYAVPPLRLPDLNEEVNAYATTEAIQLFTVRARAVKPTFTPTADDLADIAAICIQLDGLPLAIELAAARLKHFPLKTILQQLSNRFEILTAGAQDLMPHQRSLYTTIAWSYDLLPASEKNLFLCCAAFQQSWTLDAVQSVAQICISSEYRIIPGMSALLNKSLIAPVDHINGDARFTMLETLREFALHKLAQNHTLHQLVHEAHAHYFLKLAELVNQSLHTREQGEWHNRVQADHANFLSAVDWYHHLPDGAEAELSLVGALGLFWYERTYFDIGRMRAERALQRDSAHLPMEVRANAYNAAGYLAFAHGDHDRARTTHSKAVKLYRHLGDERLLAWSLFALSAQFLGFTGTGSSEQALQYSEEAYTLAQHIGNEAMQANVTPNYANALLRKGQYQTAKDILERGIELARRYELELTLIYLLSILCEIVLNEGDFVSSERYGTEQLTRAKRLNDRRMLASALQFLAQNALIQQNYSDALVHIRGAEEALQGTFDPVSHTLVAIRKAEILLEQKDLDAARDTIKQATLQAEETHLAIELKFAVEFAAYVAMARGERNRAAKLMQKLEILPQGSGNTSLILSVVQQNALSAFIQSVDRLPNEEIQLIPLAVLL